jgi:hypothetical protein
MKFKEGVYYNEEINELVVVFKKDDDMYFETNCGVTKLYWIAKEYSDITYLGPLDSPKDEVIQPKDEDVYVEDILPVNEEEDIVEEEETEDI